MTASMWQVLKKQDVMNYWKVAEFVSFVVDMVPELLMYKHRTQLNLGLRARVSNSEGQKVFIEKKKLRLWLLHLLVKESEEEEVMLNFLELIQTLLKDPEERRDFFLEVFPAEYGIQFDSDLQTLFWEFLCRLAQLLPVPDLEQIVSWLGAECSVMEDCVQSVSEPTDLKNLLQHHKQLGHLEQHGNNLCFFFVLSEQFHPLVWATASFPHSLHQGPHKWAQTQTDHEDSGDKFTEAHDHQKKEGDDQGESSSSEAFTFQLVKSSLLILFDLL
uniref:TERF1-interacting nuclear factor 2 N-terminal domain-containing protein n=1 Tax=Amphiprion ocellaris TaxID=80972 RepID=A0AAQ5YCC2_AMPOC